MKCLKYLSLIFIFFLEVSCTSIPDVNKQKIYIMVYDYQSKGIKDVEIKLDGQKVGCTDIDGRYILTLADSEAENTISLNKEGYEPFEQKINYEKDLLLYFKLADSNKYFTDAEKLLDENNYEKALFCIEKALMIKKQDDYLYLKAIILENMGSSEESSEIFKTIDEKYRE